MNISVIFMLCFVLCQNFKTASTRLALAKHQDTNAQSKLENLEHLKLDNNQMKELNSMHRVWYLQAVNALLGVMGKEAYSKMNATERRAFINCLEKIKEELDIRNGARCLVAAWDNKLVKSIPQSNIQNSSFSSKPSEQKSFIIKSTSKRLKLLQLKRVKRNIQSSADPSKEQKTDERVVSTRTMATIPEIKSKFQPPTTQIATIASMFTNWIHVFNKNVTLNRGNSYYRQLKELNKLVSSEPKIERVTKRSHSMLDIVLDGKNDNDLKGQQSRDKRAKKEHISFFNVLNRLIPSGWREKFGGILRALDSSYGDESEMPNWSLLSPKFASVFQKKTRPNNGNFLSPNLFPLYSDNSNSSILPVPDMLKAAGVSREEDQNAMLELILQASGTGPIIGKALQLFQTGSEDVLSDVMAVAHKINKRFADVEHSFSSRQKRELDRKKYTILNEKQLENILSLYNTTQNPQKPKRQEEAPITGLAFGVPSSETVELFEDISLSPFSFAPTINHAIILGPVSLSPSIFSPYILGPSLLSPNILSPGVGNPLILSPYLLEPYVLGPEIFAVGILTPYALSPNVLNPFVMSPIVLSPHILSPDVLSPTLLGGAILSPFFMSPAMFTESVLALDVLSPSFLSRKKKRRK
ncbi:moulting cycle domain-containing protein [Ditylenchus destructor]|nr:moulting cycle domain-containing protein [Ditylenchus destructor]